MIVEVIEVYTYWYAVGEIFVNVVHEPFCGNVVTTAHYYAQCLLLCPVHSSAHSALEVASRCGLTS